MNNNRRPVKAVCHKCGHEFRMGYDGIVDDDGKDTCDSCARVRRAANDYAILPGETRLTGGLLNKVHRNQ